MRPPTAEEIALAATMTGDPLTQSLAAKVRRPPGLHKRPRGRPRKDGQPPHQTPSGAASERQAAAAAVYAATNPNQPTRGDSRSTAYIPDTLEDRLRHFDEKCHNALACSFLKTFAAYGFRHAMLKHDITPVQLHGFKNGEDFRRLFDYIQAARDAATVARTCGTLADLANGEYKPKPDCLPPDTRAASLLLPALDNRFRAGQQGAAQQVQINISI